MSFSFEFLNGGSVDGVFEFKRMDGLSEVSELIDQKLSLLEGREVGMIHLLF